MHNAECGPTNHTSKDTLRSKYTHTSRHYLDSTERWS